MSLYRYFTDSIPIYLARHYWWAYLWRPGAWFFDHQTIINAILFGQYNKLLRALMTRIKPNMEGRTLQLSCAYGRLTPALIELIYPDHLHITDVSTLQLEIAQRKAATRLTVTRMNSEQLGYKDNSFTTIILFFLLHEMPAEARRNTLSECMRILAPEGTLICTEYAPLPYRHPLYRFPLSRWLLTTLEPFLASFWQEDIGMLLNEQGWQWGKHMEIRSDKLLFNGFYRVTEYCLLSGQRSNNTENH